MRDTLSRMVSCFLMSRQQTRVSGVSCCNYYSDVFLNNVRSIDVLAYNQSHESITVNVNDTTLNTTVLI